VRFEFPFFTKDGGNVKFLSMIMLPTVTRKDLCIAFSRELPRYFHKHEVDAILKEVKKYPKKHLLISLLWQTGARVSEILNIRVKDIDFYGKAIRITTLKQKKRPQRVIPVKGNLLGLLGTHIATNELKRDYRILNITRQRAFQIVKEAVLKADFDIERAHPHTFRHSFAVYAVLSGVPILVVKNWLGHSNIQNTLIYMQVLGNDTKQFIENMDF
jgi:site-specific recombinase XerD